MTILHIDPNAPALVRGAADVLLFAHIGGGTFGLISGTIAVFARKGAWLHRMAGHVFFGSMVVMTGIGAAVSPFLPERVSTVAGLLTLYLVVTGWMTVRRPAGQIGRFEIVAFVGALGVLAASAILLVLAAGTPNGRLDGLPPQPIYIFMIVGTIAAVSDLRVIVRGGISGVQRISRHLWRMCTALFVASASFFLGQQQMLPKALHGSPLLMLLAVAPLVLMVFWLIRVRFAGRARRVAASAPGSIA